MNRVAPHRWLMEKVLGIHRDKLLPDFAATTFERWARDERARAGRAGRRGGALPDLLRAEQRARDRPRHARGAARRTASTSRCVKGLVCCGMPAWEHGDLDDAARRRRARTSTCSLPFVERGRQGARDQPDLLDDDAPRVAGPARRRRTASARGAARGRGHGPERVPVVDPRTSRASRRTSSRRRRAERSPTTRPATCARRRSASRGATCSARSPASPSRHGDGVLRPRRHLRDDGRGLRALAAHRQEGVRRA